MNHFTASFGPPVLAAADGSRPWQSHTYGCTILFAGYISNRVELCRLLALPVETSESECMAAAYRSYGTRLAAHVFGEFAAAIYDPTDPLGSSIVLVHDAFGVLPIFYSLQSDQLLFGTNLEAIVAVTGTRTLDELYFARYLAVADNFDGRTPYCHIRSVPQCAAATVRNGVAKTMVAYAPGQVEVLGLETPSAYEERFRELVTQAVAAVIPSSGKVWCELSGGLDSSTVISLASGVLHASFETYSYHFSRSREADETRWREIVLEAFSLRSHLLDADATPPFSGIPQQFQAEPSGTSIVLALDAARRHIFRQHDVDFVITGMCGDAVFIGDSPEPFFLADIRNPQKLFSQLRYWGTHNPNRRSLAYWFMRYVVQPHRRPTPSVPPNWIHDPFRQTYQEVWNSAHTSSNLDIASVGDRYFWRRVLGGAVSTRSGQQHFADLCQFRNPWLYLPLVEFMAATPWPFKLHPQPDRILQRNALCGILPEAIRQRVGKGVPTQALIAGLRASDEWYSLLTDRPAIVERGYVDFQLWRRAVDLARHGLCEFPADFMRACMLEAYFHTLELKPKSANWDTSNRNFDTQLSAG